MEENILKIIGASVTAVFATTLAILLYFLKKKDDELSLIKNKISEEKYRTYFSIISLFFDLLKQDKGFATYDKNEQAKNYIDIKKNLLLLGSDEIIKKFTEFDKAKAGNSLESMTKIKHWLDLFILIRRDSGNPKTKLTIDDILLNIVEEVDYVNVKEMINKLERLESKNKL